MILVKNLNFFCLSLCKFGLKMSFDDLVHRKQVFLDYKNIPLGHFVWRYFCEDVRWGGFVWGREFIFINAADVAEC